MDRRILTLIRPPNTDNAFVMGCGEQFANGSAENRMREFWREFGKRNKHEAPLRHARVGNFHARSADNAGIVEQNVEIDDSGTITNQLLASHLALDSLQRVQQLRGRQRSFRLHHAIQEPWLREKIHRLGFIN